jgi:deoxyadenosine/deoxycytidine kinase
MWILVCGPDATGKTVAANLLAKDRFEWLKHDAVDDAPGFPKELRHLSKKLSLQLRAQTVMNTSNVVTVRSFWECAEIFAPIALQREEIAQHEYDLIRSMYDTLAPVCEPPNAVIYVQADKKMMALDRMLLKTGTADEEKLRRQCDLYDKFIARLKIPIIELEASSTPEVMKERLEFDVASLRSIRLSTQSIWKRELYND